MGKARKPKTNDLLESWSSAEANGKTYYYLNEDQLIDGRALEPPKLSADGKEEAGTGYPSSATYTRHCKDNPEYWYPEHAHKSFMTSAYMKVWGEEPDYTKAGWRKAGEQSQKIENGKEWHDTVGKEFPNALFKAETEDYIHYSCDYFAATSVMSIPSYHALTPAILLSDWKQPSDHFQIQADLTYGTTQRGRRVPPPPPAPAARRVPHKVTKIQGNRPPALTTLGNGKFAPGHKRRRRKVVRPRRAVPPPPGSSPSGPSVKLTTPTRAYEDSSKLESGPPLPPPSGPRRNGNRSIPPPPAPPAPANKGGPPAAITNVPSSDEIERMVNTVEAGYKEMQARDPADRDADKVGIQDEVRRRCMAQREFSDRRDSPVMVRLLQEIVDAQDEK